MVNHNRLGYGTAISTAVLLFCCSVPFLPTGNASDGTLWFDFYDSTCPDAEEIVHRTVANIYRLNPTVVPGLLRLFFHDCFVGGCDASILLDANPSGEPVEKASPANGLTLHGLEVIDLAKAALEAHCPATVSCADVLAFAARDAAALAGIPRFPIPSGRRDATASLLSSVLPNLPSPFLTSAGPIADLFELKGLSRREMIVLSGAHSIGGAHCGLFNNRLYNSRDSKLDMGYAEELRSKCPMPGSLMDFLVGKWRRVDLDPASGGRLDGASYYKGLVEGRGLLASDQALVEETEDRKVVRFMAKHPGSWAVEFGKAMVRLGMIDVLTGDEGEVRRSCRFVNVGFV